MANGLPSNEDDSKNKAVASVSVEEEEDDYFIEFIKELFAIKMPRCSVCDTSWLCSNNCSTSTHGDSDNGECSRKDDVSGEDDYKECCTSGLNYADLLALPPCTCTTKLIRIENPDTMTTIVNALPTTTTRTNDKHMVDDEEEENIEGWVHRLQELLYQNYTKPKKKQKMKTVSRSKNEVFLPQMPQSGMCRCCFIKFVKKSQVVTEYDYRDANQPNPKFTNETKCPSCRQKFTARKIDAIFEEAVGKESNKNQSEWTRCVEDTVKVVNFMLRLKQRMRRARQRGERKQQAAGGNEKNKKLDAVIQSWLEDERKGNPQRNEARKGELRAYLLEKDPNFRQKCEDEEYVQSLLQTEKGRIEKEEKQMEEDAKLAKMLQEEDQKQREQQIKINSGSMKTTATSPRTSPHKGSMDNFLSHKPKPQKDNRKKRHRSSGPNKPRTRIKRQCLPDDDDDVIEESSSDEIIVLNEPYLNSETDLFEISSSSSDEEEEYKDKAKVSNNKSKKEKCGNSVSSSSPMKRELKVPGLSSHCSKLKGDRQAARTNITNPIQHSRYGRSLSQDSSVEDLDDNSDLFDQKCSSSSSTTLRRSKCSDKMNAPHNRQEHAKLKPEGISKGEERKKKNTNAKTPKSKLDKSSNIDEDKLKMMVESMGFDYKRSKLALQSAKNNEERAITMLLSESASSVHESGEIVLPDE